MNLRGCPIQAGFAWGEKLVAPPIAVFERWERFAGAPPLPSVLGEVGWEQIGLAWVEEKTL